MGAGNLHETNAYLLLYERTPARTSRHRGRALKQSMVPPSATSWRAARPHHETPPTSQEHRSTPSGAVSAAATLAVGAGAAGVGAVDVTTGSALFSPGLPGARSNGDTSHAAAAPGSSSTAADGGGVGGEDGTGGGGGGSSGGGGLELSRISDLRPRPPGAPSDVGLPSNAKGNAGAEIPSGRASNGGSDCAPPGGGEERPSTTPASTYSAAAAAKGPAGELGDSPGRGSAAEGSNGAAPQVPRVAGSPEGGGAGGGHRRFSGRTDSADWGWSSDCGVR